MQIAMIFDWQWGKTHSDLNLMICKDNLKRYNVLDNEINPGDDKIADF